jgi:hypothetical protein
LKDKAIKINIRIVEQITTEKKNKDKKFKLTKKETHKKEV